MGAPRLDRIGRRPDSVVDQTTNDRRPDRHSTDSSPTWRRSAATGGATHGATGRFAGRDAHPDHAGIDIDAVTAGWPTTSAPSARCSFERLPGGHSNLTYRVDDADGRSVVLRRPPEGHLLPTAHDMGREHRLIAALAATDVPVPAALAHCEDTSVTGAPFYVMAHVDGYVLHTAELAVDHFAEAARGRDRRGRTSTCSARLHAVDPDDGRPRRPVARRRTTSPASSRRGGGSTRHQAPTTTPMLEHGARMALERTSPSRDRPASCTATTASGTASRRPDGEVVAVLDWEIATLGDPLADLGYVLATWPEPGDDLVSRPRRRRRWRRASRPAPSSPSATRPPPAPISRQHRLLRRVGQLEDGVHRPGRLPPIPRRRPRHHRHRRRGVPAHASSAATTLATGPSAAWTPASRRPEPARDEGRAPARPSSSNDERQLGSCMLLISRNSSKPWMPYSRP